MANFDRDQKNALMIPAKKVYGDVAKWDEKILGGLCNLLEALPIRDILKLASDVVSIQSFYNMILYIMILRMNKTDLPF